MTRPTLAAIVGLALLGCGDPPGPPEPAPPDAISFAVFGDGPYYLAAEKRVDVLLGDVAAAGPDFFLHVGDIDGTTCTDASYERRRRQLEDRLPATMPVVYTPGDNEWSDCDDPGMDPLERLDALRGVFFEGEWAERNRRLPGYVSQDGAYPENVRFELGSVVVATAHIVGSRNGTQRFRGRTAAHDSAVEDRTAAAVAWVGAAFERAAELSSPVVVIAFHGAPFEDDEFAPFIAALAAGAEAAAGWGGRVLLIHGDWHELTWDRPLRHPATGEVLENVRRLQTFGDPDVGWVHVIVDTAAATPADARIEARPYACGGGWWSVAGWVPDHCGRMNTQGGGG